MEICGHTDLTVSNSSSEKFPTLTGAAFDEDPFLTADAADEPPPVLAPLIADSPFKLSILVEYKLSPPAGTVPTTFSWLCSTAKMNDRWPTDEWWARGKWRDKEHKKLRSKSWAKITAQIQHPPFGHLFTTLQPRECRNMSAKAYRPKISKMGMRNECTHTY
uniref:Uncharacterized protein n=1 Tax=Romanomermis culicivorax TaxID=13658 RepID=A0A915JSF9_ROMCU